jgi:hypothetical protein
VNPDPCSNPLAQRRNCKRAIKNRPGTAATFDQARADFEEAWRVFLADRSEADFDEYRKHRAWTAWNYAMWDSGCQLPTQLVSGQSRCFCGAVIDIKGMSQHVHVAHMEAA